MEGESPVTSEEGAAPEAGDRSAGSASGGMEGEGEPEAPGPDVSEPTDEHRAVSTPADLAARAGATGVGDLFAVSAAWLTLFEDKSTFTRGDVMRVFEMLPGEHQRSLEARIKGFGQLVQQGTLIQADDGSFALSPSERERFLRLSGRE